MGAIDIWQFIDTIFKVVLGAGLSFGSIWVYRHYSQQPKKPEDDKRVVLNEEISRDVGMVNHSFAKYSSLVIESTRFGKTWPSARKVELDKVNMELVAEFKRLSDAEAKLLMLGEKTMEKTLRLYAAKIALFRKQVYVGRQDISDQEIADLKANVLSLREQFYDILSRRYDRLIAA